MKNDNQIEEEEKKRIEARQALMEEIQDDSNANDGDNYLSPATMNAIKNAED